MTNIKKAPKVLFDFMTNRVYFTAIYFIVTLLRSFPSLMSAVDPVMKLCFLWGAALLAWDFFTRRTMFKGYKSVILFIFMLFYAVTVLLNRSILYDGVKHFIYNGILLFLFYPTDEQVSLEKTKKVFVVVNDILIFLFFVASLISIGLFLFRISYPLRVGSILYYQGIHYNRLHGVYVSANPGALSSVCSVLASWVICWLNKDHFKRFRAWYIVSGVVQFIYFTLTLSNGGHLAWMVALVALAVCFAFPYLKKRFSTVVSMLLAALILVGSVAAFELATSGTRKVMVYAATGIQTALGSSHLYDPDDPDILEDPEIPDEIVLNRVEDGDDIGNGRWLIWRGGLAALKQRPLFGWADCQFYNQDDTIGDIDESKLTESQIDGLKRANGYLHNAFIQIAVCSGIVGFVLFLVFAVLVGIKYIRSLFALYRQPVYYALAAVFVFIVMMMSQQVAESHLLFTRQDVFAHLFWLYLGFGMRLIKHGERQLATDFAFMCDTPLQVLNAVSFVESNAEGCKGRSDLFLYHQFRNSEQLSEQIKKAGVFRNVYDFSKIEEKTGLRSKISTCWRLLFPKHTMKKLCRGEKGYLKNRYGTIALSFYTPFSDVLRLSVNPVRAIQFEDGLGSYVTADLERSYRTGLFAFIDRYLLNGALSYHPEHLYLNNPAMCMNSVLPVKKLTGMAEDARVAEVIKEIYGFQPSLYSDRRIVYLTQPFGSTEGGERVIDAEKETLPLLNAVDPMVRVHPRQSADAFNQFALDTVGNMWELECAESIGDKHVLIGTFSTAQFTPKMMFDREPKLIFLYKLYGAHFNNADELIACIRDSYRDPAKVLVPETPEEFKEMLQAL